MDGPGSSRPAQPTRVINRLARARWKAHAQIIALSRYRIRSTSPLQPVSSRGYRPKFGASGSYFRLVGRAIRNSTCG
jgi:hypothetical protein